MGDKTNDRAPAGARTRQRLARRQLRLAACAGLALAPVLALAQTAVFTPSAGFEFALEDLAPLAGLGSLTGSALDFVASEVGSSRLVKGAPYSAEAVSETTQVLMDGNRIQRRSTQRLARDSEGRTRVERIGRDGAVESVVINDVVARKRYWLVPERKQVIELGGGGRVPRARIAPEPPTPPGAAPAPPAQPAPPAPPTPPATMSGEEARSWAEEMRRWAREFSARWRADGGHADTNVEHAADGSMRVIVRRAPADTVDARSVDVDVVRVVEATHLAPGVAPEAQATPMPVHVPIPPLPMVAAPLGQGVTTSLGSRDFDRVRADGARTTWTIAAGRIGNDKPIEVVSERWYSPDLLLVVSSRYFDPRSGETTYRLTNLKRAEPDAALFQVPEDYERRGARKRREKN
jgi:hypothetical protein